MGSFTSGPENNNVPNAVHISGKKMSSAKLPLPNLQNLQNFGFIKFKVTLSTSFAFYSFIFF